MASHIISNALKHCNIDLSECPTTLNTTCLQKLTNDCFDRMNKNIISKEQRGGGNDSALNYDSIIPYLIANNIKVLKSSTNVPLFILNTVKSSHLVSYDMNNEIEVSAILSTLDIANINSVLSRKPKKYF